MNVSRRDFLKYLGAAATLAAVPSIVGARRVASAPFFRDGPSVLYECAPLEAGRTYTFTATARFAGQNWGLFVAGVKAEGGETAVRIPLAPNHSMTEPCMSLEPMSVYTPIAATDQELINYTSGKDVLIPKGVEIGRRTNVLLNTAEGG